METKLFAIIGASKGIGLALTQQLLEEGHHVFATYANTNPTFTHPNLTWVHYNVMEPTALQFPEILDDLVY